MTDALNYRLGSQAGVLRQQTEKSPWQGSPLSTWKGAAKVVFWLPTMAGKGSDRTVTPVAEEVLSLHTRHLQGPCDPSSCTTFMLSTHWGRAVTGKKKSLAYMYKGPLWSCPTLCNPVECGLPGFSVMRFCRQEYWNVLANTGCHTLLEHCISWCLSHQHLWVPGAARTPGSQAATPHPTWSSLGQTQVLQCSLSSTPQWMTHLQRWK